MENLILSDRTQKKPGEIQAAGKAEPLKSARPGIEPGKEYQTGILLYCFRISGKALKSTFYERKQEVFMKIQCQKSQLVEAVSNVQRAVSSKSTLAALEGILLKTTTNGDLKLCGYDLELGITTVIEAQVDEPGEVVLSARLFGDIVRRLPDETVTILVDEKMITQITCGPSEFSIVGIPSSEYPELPSVEGASSIDLTSPILKSMIRQTLFAVADTDAKPVHTGTLFNIENGIIRLVSVDGYRLAMRTEMINLKFEEEDEIRFVVPGKTLSEVIKLLPDQDENVEILVGRRHIIFKIEKYSVISRLLEGEFLDYKAAIPAQFTTEVTVNTRNLINSVERVSLLITDRLKSPVRCIFSEDGEIKISCVTSIGKANDELSAQITGPEVEIGFNNRYLLDALRNADTDEVKVQLTGPVSPMKIVPTQGDSFLFLVLPVRLKQE
ncbi:DNA polymerase III, beta subunit [[Clostridium] leptum DSM 753]|uniref:Beta sliding clamp n=3 Tax=[Clostridium] leptum TaxID=1535 RepID=A7VRS4_9FIRM|nr:DNA polymerase III, beta subunit [[Clostridium] leptum DSM 753]